MARINDIIKQWIAWNRAFVRTQKQNRIIHGKQPERTEHLYRRVLKESEPVFVLSTGRCGTALLTQLLQHHHNLDVKHEPMPSLMYHAKKAYENSSNGDLLAHWFDAARYELIRDSFLLKKRYIETNNRVTFFANGIATLYPNAKFIHLERNVNDFVQSGISRDWYDYYKIADEGRITSSSGAFNWNELKQIEKVTWLWLETNRFIRSFTSAHPDRSYFVKSEDLFSNVSKIEEMLQFLNIAGISSNTIRNQIKKKVNRQSASSIRKLSKDDIQIIQNFLKNHA